MTSKGRWPSPFTFKQPNELISSLSKGNNAHNLPILPSIVKTNSDSRTSLSPRKTFSRQGTSSFTQAITNDSRSMSPIKSFANNGNGQRKSFKTPGFDFLPATFTISNEIRSMSPPKAFGNHSHSPTKIFKTTGFDFLPEKGEKPEHERSPTKILKTTAFDFLPEKGEKPENERKLKKFGTLMYLQQVSVEDKEQESRERYKSARKYIRDIQKTNIYEDGNGRVNSKKKVTEESTRILKIVDHVFSIMNISVKLIKEPLYDSGMTIIPVQDTELLTTFYQKLVPEICDFPYAFLVKLKISLLTICEEVAVFKESYQQVLENKKNIGLFILQESLTPEAVRECWYKIILWHFVKAEPAMYEEWKAMIHYENINRSPKKREFKGEMEELIHTLICVIKPEEAGKIRQLHAQEKAKFVKRKLREFEPICLDEEWWDMKYKEQMYY